MILLGRLSSQIGERSEEGNRYVAKMCLNEPSLLKEIKCGLTVSDDRLVGDCTEVLTFIAEQQPELIIQYSNDLLNLIDHKKSKVRWEAMHAISFIVGYIPDEITPLLPKLSRMINEDNSTIVRDYCIETFCQYARIGEKEALEVFPYLKIALYAWGGKHQARVLKGFLFICQSTDKFTLEIRGLTEDYIDDKRGVVKKAVKALVKLIDGSVTTSK